MANFESLVARLRSNSKKLSQKTAFHYFAENSDIPTSLTFHELDQKSRAMAAAIQKVAVPGDRALMLFNSGLEFITAVQTPI